MQVVSAESRELFVEPPNAPWQLARVTVTGCAEPTVVRIAGRGVSGEAVAEIGQEHVEVPITVDHPIVLVQGSIEVMGGTYNEPNTNLTGPATAIRNLLHGIAFQRDVLGVDPATAWRLDVFGHDPQIPGPGRLRRSACLLTCGKGDCDMNVHSVATVAGTPVPVDEVDAWEARLRSDRNAAALPARDTSEGRQLRRWITQLIVTERVVAVEAVARGLTPPDAPTEVELLTDVTARLEIGSIDAAMLTDLLARALFADVASGVRVTDIEAVEYHVRNPHRFAVLGPAQHGWCTPAVADQPFEQVRCAIIELLSGAARRRAFRTWLDARCAALVQLAPGYEHPGDPRQPDNTHRH